MERKILLLFVFISGILMFLYEVVEAQGSKNYLKGKFYRSVKNHFLIATNKMNESRFDKSVIAMLESDEDGAWGLVINKPIGRLPLALLIDPSLNSSKKREELYAINVEVFWGGPVNVKEIFILHSNEYQSDSTKKYGNFSVSQDYDILFDIAKKTGPEKSLIILGYSGWGDGQLEGEMERDYWILSDIDLNILFEEKSNTKWNKAYKNSFLKI